MHEDLESKPTSLHKGYVTVYYPEHPASWKGSGNIYMHRLVMERKLGRYLEPWEHVHHRNKDRKDSDPKNLKLVTRNSHGREHRILEPIRCKGCGRKFQPDRAARLYCSLVCASSKVEMPSKTDLEKLIWQMPTTKVAQQFGISDVAVGKWCKKLGIEKPPRGYWTGM